ncbi:helix-turn-helix domain-containing protein [Streptomyces sp. FR-008]|uniref:helix-turn-helix domain-containing protein n=1 Tax=Streptomyces sp. FR-008 TaxID=206662 RepID=UPI00096B084C|nr:helix-turn-helix domain-containing protein [Streptomyces sp. FR-008]
MGQPFPSASALAERVGVSRPTVTKTLEKLETAGVLAGADAASRDRPKGGGLERYAVPGHPHQQQ